MSASVSDSPDYYTVSVIVPAFNEEANIGRAIEQIRCEPWTKCWVLQEIFAVDDYSSDATAAIVREAARSDPRVHLIRQEQRQGKNAGIRRAAGLARSDIIVVIDADVLVPKPCLVETLDRFLDDPGLSAVSCIIEPLPPRSWRERASYSQALFVAELKRRNAAYLSAVYAVRAGAQQALEVRECVADDAYVTLWLYSNGYRFAIQPSATAYIRAATGLRDFAKQTLRGRFGDVATKQALRPTNLPRRNLLALVAALVSAFVRDPISFLYYVAWYSTILLTPQAWWVKQISLSAFETVQSTKDIGAGGLP